MLRPSTLLFVLLALSGAAYWFLASRSNVEPTPSPSPQAAPSSIVEMVAPVTTPIASTDSAQHIAQLERMTQSLQDQLAALETENKALRRENSDLIDQLAKIGIQRDGKVGMPSPKPAQANRVSTKPADVDWTKLGTDLQALRESKDPMPTVRPVPLTDLEDVILTQLKTGYPTDSSTRYGSALAALGLIPEAIDPLPLLAAFRARQIGGWASSDALLVADPKTSTDDAPVLSNPALALAFALSQKGFTRSASNLRTTDQRLVAHGLMLGEASLTRFLHDIRTQAPPDLNELPAEDPDHPLNLVPLPEFLRSLELFGPMSGFAFAQAQHSAGGFAELRKAYSKLPQSSAEMRDPERYAQPDQLSVPQLSWKSLRVGKADPYWDDCLGAHAVFAMLRRFNEENIAAQTANGWQTDRLLTYPSGGDRDHAVWVTRWTTPEDAKRFTNAMISWLTQFYDGEEGMTVEKEQLSLKGKTRRVTLRRLADHHRVLLIDAANAEFHDAAEKIFAQ